jgi:hypothetical protein
MVVEPHVSIPNVTSPYEHEEEHEGKDNDNDVPEITINAATQIRGHGNIISIAQMDSMRISNLITSILSGENTKAATADAACPLTPPSPRASVVARQEETSRTEVRGVKKYPNINITVNCGATIIGDRNIVGPGLGDIARQMQMAQRNQALQAQHAAAAAAAATTKGQKMPSPPSQARDTLYQAQAAIAQHHGVLYPAQAPANGVSTPPMSRSSSWHSDGSAKRKAEDGGEGVAKKQC